MTKQEDHVSSMITVIWQVICEFPTPHVHKLSQIYLRHMAYMISFKVQDTAYCKKNPTNKTKTVGADL